MDKKSGLIISSIHDPTQKLDVSRKQKDGSKKLFPCPVPIVDYNKHMGYVDLSDMLKGLYDIDRKSKKWWMQIFLHLLDVSVVNSFLIHKELSIEEITFFEFRCKLVYGLKRKSTATLETSCSKKKKNFKNKVFEEIRQDHVKFLKCRYVSVGIEIAFQLFIKNDYFIIFCRVFMKIKLRLCAWKSYTRIT